MRPYTYVCVKAGCREVVTLDAQTKRDAERQLRLDGWRIPDKRSKVDLLLCPHHHGLVKRMVII